MESAWGRRLAVIVRPRGVEALAGLLVANLLAWAWALANFRGHPDLLSLALLAWVLGLRHAVDADHIAAIDNVVRKLMQEGRRPRAVGLFFSLGHSTVVLVACIALAVATSNAAEKLATWKSVGAYVGTLVSAFFLLVIALSNLAIFRRLWRIRRGVQEVEQPVLGGGPMARLLAPVLRSVRRSWHMFPLGVLFGLGFDTATEVGLLSIAAAQVAKGLSLWQMLAFPSLFAAAMALIDTADSSLMVGAYGWALADPTRRLRYNLVVTGVSVAVAIGIGTAEILGMLGDQLGVHGGLPDGVWNWITAWNANSSRIGFAVIGFFLAAWAGASLLSNRLRSPARR